MNQVLSPGARTGFVRIPASKSQAHRLLICAALGERDILLRCDGISRDIDATISCLNAMGADIREKATGELLVRPITQIPDGLCHLNCGESGSTLRFLLPLVGALGIDAVFHREGRLPQRPLAPLDEELRCHGMLVEEEGASLFCRGKLRAGVYSLPGNVSSQFVSGLLMALPLLERESHLNVTGSVESAGYIAMTEEALRLSDIRLDRSCYFYTIPGGQRPRLPENLAVEGDWSNAAFFLCLGALSPKGVKVSGLSRNSTQGDRAVLELLRGFGAEIFETENAVMIRRGSLCGQAIDASPVPDLIPVLSVVAAAAEGETQIYHAGRLRLKESDRLHSTSAMLRALGADVSELPEGLRICGRSRLTGGTVDSMGDHRIAMAAAVAASVCAEELVVANAECVQKSYPRFWKDWEGLEEDR